MHTTALYQLVSALATLALFTLPTATEALPVRGALGNLGARARAAKRAASHGAIQQPEMAAVEKRFAARSSTAMPINAKHELAAKTKREQTVITSEEGQVEKVKRDLSDALQGAAAEGKIALGAGEAVIGLVQPSFIKPHVLAAEAPSPVAVAAPQANEEAVYQSYIAAMNNPLTTAAATVPAPASATMMAAVAAAPSDTVLMQYQVDAAAQNSASPDADAIYRSYIAQMDAPASAAA